MTTASENTAVPSVAAPIPSIGIRLARFLWRIARLFLIAYVLFLGFLFFAQSRMIFTGRRTQGKLASQVHPPSGTELVRLSTSDGAKIAALFGPALTPEGKRRPDAAKQPTVLFFYGNGMCLKDCLEEFHAFRRLGANVLIPDYLGYGMSEGDASERGCYATANACYNYLLTRKDIDSHKIVAAGWSLGGAVAIDLASRRPVAGLAVFYTFTCMADLVHRVFPFAPTSLLLRQRFESLAKMSQVRCPILIGHDRHDTLVPFAMSAQLAAAAPTPVQRFVVEKGNHADFFSTGMPQTLSALREFLGRLVTLR